MSAITADQGIRRELRNAFSLFCFIQFFILLALTIYSYHYSEDLSFARIVENREGAVTEYTTFDELPTEWKLPIENLEPGTWELSVDNSAELAGIELHVHVWDDDGSRSYRTLAFVEQDESFNLIRTYGLFAFLSALCMGLFALWASLYMARRISTPLEGVARLLAEHRPGDARPDFSSLAKSSEIALVTDHLDMSFDRVNASLERERLFARNVSHELRTPLTVVRTAVDNASDGTATQRSTSLNSARRALDEMDLLTAACLGLARERPETARHPPVEIGALTKSIVTSSLYLLDEKNVALDVQITPDAHKAQADEALARLAIGNLVRNAFIHCPGGDIGINVSSHCIQVTNTAPDLDARVFDRLSQPFSQTPDSKGHGLGLSVLGQSCQRLGWTARSSAGTDSVSIEVVFAPA